MDDLLVLIIVAIIAALLLFRRSHGVHRSSLAVNNIAAQHGAFSNYEPIIDRNDIDNDYQLAKHSPGLSRSLWRIAEYVINDFITPWFPNISDNAEFPNDIRDIFENLFAKVATRAVRIDWPTFIVRHVVTTLSDLMRIYRLTEQALQTRIPGYKSFTSEQRVALVRGELFKVYRLHHAISPHMEQSAAVSKEYLRRISTALLSRVVRTRDFNCDAIRTLGREILTNNILSPVMKFVTPYWVNVGLVVVLSHDPTNGGDEKSSDGKDDDSDTSLLSLDDEHDNHHDADDTHDNDDDDDNDGDDHEHDDEDLPPIDLSDANTDVSSTSLSSVSETSRAVRKDSDLTQKMRDWTAEKNRRQKEHQRKVVAMERKRVADANASDAAVAAAVVAATAAAAPITAVVPPAPPSRGLLPGILASMSMGVIGGSNHREDTRATPISSPSVIPSSSSSSLSSSSPLQSRINMSHTTTGNSATITPTNGNDTSNVGDTATSTDVLPLPSQIINSSWQVRITRAITQFDPKPYVSYEMHVRNGLFQWRIAKRYNRFVELHTRLKKSLTNFDAQLPRKTFLGFGNFSQSFIQTRKTDLQNYLSQLQMNKNVLESPLLREFLLPSADSAPSESGDDTSDASPSPSSSSTAPLPAFSFGGHTLINSSSSYLSESPRAARTSSAAIASSSPSLQRSVSAAIISHGTQDGPRTTPMGPGALVRQSSQQSSSSSSSLSSSSVSSSMVSPSMGPSSYYSTSVPSPLLSSSSSPPLSSLMASSPLLPSLIPSSPPSHDTSSSSSSTSSTPSSSSSSSLRARSRVSRTPSSTATTSSSSSSTPTAGRRTGVRTISAGIASFFRIGNRDRTHGEPISPLLASTSTAGSSSSSSSSSSNSSIIAGTISSDTKLSAASLRRGESQPLTDTNTSTTTTSTTTSSNSSSIIGGTSSSTSVSTNGVPTTPNRSGTPSTAAAATTASGIPSYKRAIWNENKQLAQPVYDLLDELFSISSRGWVRRHTTWMAKQIIQLLFNSDINTMISARVEWALSEPRLVGMVDWIANIVWPDGKLFTAAAPPSAEEIAKYKEDAHMLVSKAMPISLRRLLGHTICSESSEKFFQFCQVEPLIQHLAYSVLDALVLELFPELKKKLGAR